MKTEKEKVIYAVFTPKVNPIRVPVDFTNGGQLGRIFFKKFGSLVNSTNTLETNYRKDTTDCAYVRALTDAHVMEAQRLAGFLEAGYNVDVTFEEEEKD